MPAQAAVFQLRQQHRRLGDATWRLIYLLQKANDTAASLASPVPLPRLGRRRTPTTSPDGSMRPTRAGSAEAAGQLHTIWPLPHGCCCGSCAAALLCCLADFCHQQICMINVLVEIWRQHTGRLLLPVYWQGFIPTQQTSAVTRRQHNIGVLADFVSNVLAELHCTYTSGSVWHVTAFKL